MVRVCSIKEAFTFPKSIYGTDVMLRT